ncbi:MutS-like protein [Homalodisca vitripennis]|nr:MutS-like protein [Homalodisca vitripennis]
MAQWVKQPLRDLAAINERHDIVNTIANDTGLRQALTEENLRHIPDLQVLSNRLQRKKASMQDCYRIYQALKKFPFLLETLGEENVTISSVFFQPMQALLLDMQNLQEMIESTLDFSLVDKGEFLIKPEFDDDLKEASPGKHSDSSRFLTAQPLAGLGFIVLPAFGCYQFPAAPTLSSFWSLRTGGLKDISGICASKIRIFPLNLYNLVSVSSDPKIRLLLRVLLNCEEESHMHSFVGSVMSCHNTMLAATALLFNIHVSCHVKVVCDNPICYNGLGVISGHMKFGVRPALSANRSTVIPSSCSRAELLSKKCLL